MTFLKYEDAENSSPLQCARYAEVQGTRAARTTWNQYGLGSVRVL